MAGLDAACCDSDRPAGDTEGRPALDAATRRRIRPSGWHPGGLGWGCRGALTDAVVVAVDDNEDGWRDDLESRGGELNDSLVWRTEDRLHTDEATVAMLVELAAADDAVGRVITDLEVNSPGNGSVWASGRACVDGTPALLKLGARPSERDWMSAVAAANADVVPRVFGSGELRGVGWLVLERCAATLDRRSPAHVASVLTAAARWQCAGAAIEVATDAMGPDWLYEMLGAAASQSCPGDIAGVIGGVERNWEFVVSECGLTPNHGDVHTANAVARDPTGPALLIDPMPIATVWPWDAAYLEAVVAPYLGPAEVGYGAGFVHALARERRVLGLTDHEDQLDRVESVVLAWAAAAWWRMAPWRHANAQWRAWVERCVAPPT